MHKFVLLLMFHSADTWTVETWQLIIVKSSFWEYYIIVINIISSSTFSSCWTVVCYCFRCCCGDYIRLRSFACNFASSAGVCVFKVKVTVRIRLFTHIFWNYESLNAAELGVMVHRELEFCAKSWIAVFEVKVTVMFRSSRILVFSYFLKCEIFHHQTSYGGASSWVRVMYESSKCYFQG